MIFSAPKIKAGIVVVVLIAGAGTVLTLYGRTESPPNMPSSVIAILPSETIHSADWYFAHPGALKQDESRCAGDAGTISQAACQNVSSADNQIGVIEMQKAAAQNGTSDNTGN